MLDVGQCPNMVGPQLCVCPCCIGLSQQTTVAEILLNYFKMFVNKILGSGVLFSWIKTQNGYLVCSYFYMFIYL